VDVGQQGLQSGDIFRLFGQERVERVLRRARRVDAPFDTDPLDRLVEAEAPGDDADRTDNRGRVSVDLIAVSAS
jgi:hypothetical protein